MRQEPFTKRAVAFIDGQNLFHSAKAAFGYGHPNFDPLKLAGAVCAEHAWELASTNFYTGIPSAVDNHFWNHFWTAKLAAMGTRGVKCFSRPLRYRNQTVKIPGGATSTTTIIGQEKGIDVRIALDIVRMAIDAEFDVALIFSQDQDLSEAVDDVRHLSKRDDRWMKVACAFPFSPTVLKARGINGTDWFRISRSMYDACLDDADYRPR